MHVAPSFSLARALLACTQTLFYFCFSSFRKHWRARSIDFLFAPPLPPHWRSINPRGFYILSRALYGL